MWSGMLSSDSFSMSVLCRELFLNTNIGLLP